MARGQFPGPLLRLVEGRRVTVDVHNDTDTPELVHWHGQTISSDVDGTSEEGTPFVPARGTRRISKSNPGAYDREVFLVFGFMALFNYS